MKLKCPICGAPTDSETSAEFPFCSDRCRILDLGNWASGKYVISSPAFDEDFDEIAESDPETAHAGNGSSKSQAPSKPEEGDPDEE